MMASRLIELNVHGDDRGKLIAIEGGGNGDSSIPFDIKRVYYIYDTLPDTVRGMHAHRSLQQLLVCVSGDCVVMCDDGLIRTEYSLNCPGKALYISGLVWREMRKFSKGTVLMVLASDYYNEADYIRDYSTFIKAVKHDTRLG